MVRVWVLYFNYVPSNPLILFLDWFVYIVYFIYLSSMRINIDIPDDRMYDLKIVVACSDKKDRKTWIQDLVVEAIENKFHELSRESRNQD